MFIINQPFGGTPHFMKPPHGSSWIIRFVTGDQSFITGSSMSRSTFSDLSASCASRRAAFLLSNSAVLTMTMTTSMDQSNGNLSNLNWKHLETRVFYGFYLQLYSFNMFQPYCFALTWKSRIEICPCFPHPEFGTSSPVLQWLLRCSSCVPRVFRNPCGKCCGGCLCHRPRVLMVLRPLT